MKEPARKTLICILYSVRFFSQFKYREDKSMITQYLYHFKVRCGEMKKC
jgi:hypothetical protein